MDRQQPLSPPPAIPRARVMRPLRSSSLLSGPSSFRSPLRGDDQWRAVLIAQASSAARAAVVGLIGMGSIVGRLGGGVLLDGSTPRSRREQRDGDGGHGDQLLYSQANMGARSPASGWAFHRHRGDACAILPAAFGMRSSAHCSARSMACAVRHRLRPLASNMCMTWWRATIPSWALIPLCLLTAILFLALGRYPGFGETGAGRLCKGPALARPRIDPNALYVRLMRAIGLSAISARRWPQSEESRVRPVTRALAKVSRSRPPRRNSSSWSRHRGLRLPPRPWHRRRSRESAIAPPCRNQGGPGRCAETAGCEPRRRPARRRTPGFGIGRTSGRHRGCGESIGGSELGDRLIAAKRRPARAPVRLLWSSRRRSESKWRAERPVIDPEAIVACALKRSSRLHTEIVPHTSRVMIAPSAMPPSRWSPAMPIVGQLELHMAPSGRDNAARSGHYGPPQESACRSGVRRILSAQPSIPSPAFIATPRNAKPFRPLSGIAPLVDGR